ncbi:hypothetical protein ACFWA9_23770 [Kitasatospora sp. NPDC059973]|uniref:hypothetical protein n=1 Tax=Kitasatospora sp. NPDC059973 TaxID=3347020 RepID=UPI00368B2D81
MGDAAPGGGQDRDTAGHARSADCRRAFAEVSPEDAAALVTRVLTGPDPATASEAVREYLGRRAAELLTDPGYPAWCLAMTGPVAADASAARRLREWTLLRAVTLDEPWEADTLLAASDWLQLRTAEESSAVIALAVLAEGGRTRRIRNTARSRLTGA